MFEVFLLFLTMLQAFNPIVYDDSKILILGTMPSEKSLHKQEYYGNLTNKFWLLLFETFQFEPTKDYIKKNNFLKQNNIALWDVLAFCEREGSLDSAIKNEIANDFTSFFERYSKIEHIIFSSKNAYKLYKKYVNNFYGCCYTVLPSSSGAYAAMNYNEKLNNWKVIKNIHENLTKK